MQSRGGRKMSFKFLIMNLDFKIGVEMNLLNSNNPTFYENINLTT